MKPALLTAVAVAIAASACSTTTTTAGTPTPTTAESGPPIAEQRWAALPERPVPDSSLRVDQQGRQYGAAPYPGVQIVQSLGGADIERCTAGPLVEDRTGTRGFLTAGHCDVKPGAPVSTFRSPAATAADLAPAGTYAGSIQDPDLDATFLGLAPGVEPDPAATMIANRWPVARLMSMDEARQLAPGTTICIDAAHAGVRCGELLAALGSSIRAEIPGGERGDSGGAMFLVSEDGAASIVGIVQMVGNGVVEATFAEPAMQRLGLSLIPQR